MNFKKGNLYTSENEAYYDLLGFTANSQKNKNGELIMGAGNAKVVRDRYKDSAKIFGELIKEDIFYIKGSKSLKIFAFQTKIKWRDKSHIDVIEEGIKRLKKYAEENENMKIALPFPGISNGGLSREDILPMLEVLPDNVDIWEY